MLQEGVAPFFVGSGLRALRNAPLRQRLHDLHGFQADGNDLPHQPHDVFRVVLAVGVVGDAAALVGLNLVLVDDPLQRRRLPKRYP